MIAFAIVMHVPAYRLTLPLISLQDCYSNQFTTTLVKAPYLAAHHLLASTRSKDASNFISSLSNETLYLNLLSKAETSLAWLQHIKESDLRHCSKEQH